MKKKFIFFIFYSCFSLVAKAQCSLGPSNIPDNNSAGVSFSFTNQTIPNWGSFRIQINFTTRHTWAGDLRATVQISGCGSANGTYTLFNFQTSGFGSSCDMSGIYTFQSTGTNYLSTNGGTPSNPIPACTGSPTTVPPGTYTSATQWPTSGSCTNATITVTIVDDQALDVGAASVNLVGSVGCFPLPAKLISFAGRNMISGIELNWTTSQEINSSHFLIEHSTNNIHWQGIGTVTAAGNSLNNKDYSFIHTTPSVESNFYRLKQVDIDGKSEYSNVLWIKRNTSSTNNIQITPNPVFSDEVVIRLNSAENYLAEMAVIDFTGKVVFKNKISVFRGVNTYKIAGIPLTKGIYTVIVKGNQHNHNQTNSATFILVNATK